MSTFTVTAEKDCRPNTTAGSRRTSGGTRTRFPLLEGTYWVVSHRFHAKLVLSCRKGEKTTLEEDGFQKVCLATSRSCQNGASSLMHMSSRKKKCWNPASGGEADHREERMPGVDNERRQSRAAIMPGTGLVNFQEMVGTTENKKETSDGTGRTLSRR